MSSDVKPPIPRQMAERTLVVSVTILVIVAVVQIIAAAIALFPRVSFDFVTLDGARVSTTEPTTSVTVSTEGQTVPTGAVPEPSAEAVQNANAMLAEAQRLYEQGNLQASLEALAEADHILPNNPIVLYQMAVLNSQLGNQVEAETLFRRIASMEVDMSNPDYAHVKQQAQLAVTGAGATAAGTGSNQMRDEVGIPIGSTFGIIDCRLVDGQPGYKTLRLATKAASDKEIDVGDVKIAYYFYEQSDTGEIIPNTQSQTWEPTSAPLEWKNGEPELIDVHYRLPLEDRGDLPPLQFYGYVVGIYYKGELQDSRAEPVSLLDEFPLKLYVSESVSDTVE